MALTHKLSHNNTALISQPAQVPADLVDKLERLALVDFRTKQGLVCLEKAIRFADQLHVVDTSGVEPMDSILEDRCGTNTVCLHVTIVSTVMMNMTQVVWLQHV